MPASGPAARPGRVLGSEFLGGRAFPRDPHGNGCADTYDNRERKSAWAPTGPRVAPSHDYSPAARRDDGLLAPQTCVLR